jgi:NADH:ubiquinone oxidoreductase subunit F (NADH-binding)
VGSQRAYDILEHITQGRGTLSELEEIPNLAQQMEATSNCGLGQTAAVPLRDTLKHFRAEVEAHIRLGVCPTGVCPMTV